MNKCSRCGAELMDNARFCTVCGATLADEFAYQQTPQQEPQQEPQQPVYEQQASQQPVYEQQAPQNYKEYVYNQPGAYKPVPDNSIPVETPQQDTLYRQAVSDAKYREPQQINNVSYQQQAPNYGQGPQYSQNPQYQAPNYGQPAYDQGIQYQQPARKKLGAGAIIGIIIGVLALIAVIAFLVFAVFGLAGNKNGSCDAAVKEVESAINSDDPSDLFKLLPLDDSFADLFNDYYGSSITNTSALNFTILSIEKLTEEELAFYETEGSFSALNKELNGEYFDLTEGYRAKVKIDGADDGTLIFCKIKGDSKLYLFAIDAAGITLQ